MTREEFLKLHGGGWKTLFFQYPYKKAKRNLCIGILLSISIVLLCTLLNRDLYKMIDIIVQDALTVFPNLIGFILGGFAIIIGFGNKEFLLKASKPLSTGKSLYQSYSFVFAMSLSILTFTLLVSFIYHLVISVNIAISASQAFVFNILFLFLILFLVFISLLSVLDMVINVFSLAQAHHSTLFLEQKKQKKKGTPIRPRERKFKVRH